MLSPLPHNEDAVSQVNGIILLVVITIIAAALVLILCLGFQMPHGEDEIQDTFKIINVNHYDETSGKLDYNSYITLINNGKDSYRNRYLAVKLFVNGKPANCNLVTLNAYAYCHSFHYGVDTIGGVGTEGNMDSYLSRWYPGQQLYIDFSDGTFRPGDTICIEVYDRMTNQLISRDTYPPAKKYTTKWFYNYFLNHQAA
jgi:hypothetical protein